MSSSNPQNTPVLLLVNLGGITSADIVPVCKLPRRLCITAVKLLNAGAIVADNTNYVTVILKNGSTALATLDSRAANEGAIADNVAKDFTLTAAASTEGHRENAIDLDADTTLTLDYAEGGTVALTAAQLQINGYWR